jgi:hypothetical protein
METRRDAARMTFAKQFHEIEQKFAAAAAADGDIYLPNFTPSGPVDAVLVGMEPSLGRWARTPAEADRKIAAGFRNFMWSPEDFILHWAARRTLIPSDGTYHITDVSKGAMPVRQANVHRRARYARWMALLDEEIGLVAKPDARIVAIGGQVGRLLKRNKAGRNVTCVMHYGAWARARDAEVEGQEAAFLEFADTLSMQDIVDVADEVLRENSVPDALSAETIARLGKAQLSESRKKLAFIYSRVFARIR